MAIQNVGLTTSAVASTYQTTPTTKEKNADKSSSGAAKTQADDVYGKAAEYVKSSDADTATASSTKTDRSALIQQLKDDMEAQKASLMEIVRKTMAGQGTAIGNASSEDDVWHFLASGKFTIDEAAKAKAQEAISEDGYWGVEKTSDRILDFAKALTGDDPTKADEMFKAFKKGYQQATKSWGKDLPDISKKTYDAVEKKFNEWKNSAKTSSTDTDDTKKTSETDKAPIKDGKVTEKQ
ncbi:MAG: hypothetical protein VZQ80_11055 [Lachnospiraceae bacterium]|nr:hypothetical protein [Lachnospiraceae bacterium]